MSRKVGSGEADTADGGQSEDCVAIIYAARDVIKEEIKRMSQKDDVAEILSSYASLRSIKADLLAMDVPEELRPSLEKCLSEIRIVESMARVLKEMCAYIGANEEAQHG